MSRVEQVRRAARCFATSDVSENVKLAAWLAAEVTLGGSVAQLGITPSIIVLDAVADRVEVAETTEADLAALRNSAEELGIELRRTRLVESISDIEGPLDLLIVGIHGHFPAAIVAWHELAPFLRPGGMFVVENESIRANALLVRFLRAEPGWVVRHRVGGAVVFIREAASESVPSWEQQPWNRRWETLDARLTRWYRALGRG